MHKILGIRWGVDCTLGMFAQHRSFLNNKRLRVEESQTLVESNKIPPLNIAYADRLKYGVLRITEFCIMQLT